MKTTTHSVENHTQIIIAALYTCFDQLNVALCSGTLPKPAFTLIPAGRRRALGWHWANRWNIGGKSVNEINFCTEWLKRPFEELMETMIHEMAHLKNAAAGIKDCTSAQRHNKHFKRAAEELGLTVEKRGNKGFAKTALGAAAKAAVDALKVDRAVLNITRDPPRTVDRVERKGGVSRTKSRIAVNTGPGTYDLLERLAAKTGRAKADLVTEALTDLAGKLGVKLPAEAAGAEAEA